MTPARATPRRAVLEPHEGERHACNDGNACTQTDTCQTGVCAGANPVTCAASDQCHDAGTCDPATGACSNPSEVERHVVQRRQRLHADRHVPERRLHRREPGGLRGVRPVPRRGHVRPGSRACSNPAKADGTACNDGNACTQTDTCQAGVCAGANPVTCAASGPVPRCGHLRPGDGPVLEPAEGRRHDVQRRQRCTQTDTCQAGACVGGEPGRVRGADQCHVAGTCNPATGQCSNPIEGQRHGVQRRQRVHADRHLPERRVHRREPGRLHGVGPVPRRWAPATRARACSNPSKERRHGLQRRQRVHADRHLPERAPASGANPVTCAASDQCHTRARAIRRRDVLEPERRPTARPATTATPAPRPTRARRGACTGANPVTCAASDQCHDAGTCDPATGACSNPAKANGTACNDGNACTQTDTCQSGACTGANPVRVRRRTSATSSAHATRRRASARTRQARRHELQRRQRMHPDGHLPDRRLRRREPRHLHSAGPMPFGWHLRSSNGHLLRATQGRRYHLR